MVEEEIAREGNPICHNGKSLHGGTTVETSIQLLYSIPQRIVNVVPNKDIGTTWIHAISGLQVVH